MSTTLASATQITENRVSILVQAEYATSLFKFLKTKGVDCLSPEGAVFSRKRAYIDQNGRRQVEDVAIESDIIAKGKLADFEKWISEWILPEK